MQYPEFLDFPLIYHLNNWMPALVFYADKSSFAEYKKTIVSISIIMSFTSLFVTSMIISYKEYGAFIRGSTTLLYRFCPFWDNPNTKLYSQMHNDKFKMSIHYILSTIYGLLVSFFLNSFMWLFYGLMSMLYFNLGFIFVFCIFAPLSICGYGLYRKFNDPLGWQILTLVRSKWDSWK